MKALMVFLMCVFACTQSYAEEPNMDLEVKQLLEHFQPLMNGDEEVMDNAELVVNVDQPGDTKVHDGRRENHQQRGRRPAIMGDEVESVDSTAK